MTVQLPEDARHLSIQQLQALTGIAKGLTRVSDSLLAIDDSAEALEETERLNRAREDVRMTGLRNLLMQAITSTVELWSTDASVGDVGVLYLSCSQACLPLSDSQRIYQGNDLITLRCDAHIVASWSIAEDRLSGSTKTAYWRLVVLDQHARRSAGSPITATSQV